MKINWGYKILIVYGLFVAGLMYMVYLATRENKDLVTENYYAEELKYQKVIDQSSNTAALSDKIEIAHSGDTITMVFPQEFRQMELNGTWELYFAADMRKDQHGNFLLKDGKSVIVVPKDTKGFYKLSLKWRFQEKDYYDEKELSF